MTNNSEFLSQEEIETLLTNVGEQTVPQLEPKSGDVGTNKAAMRYDFAKQERIVGGKMDTLDIIHNRAARLLEQSLYALLHQPAEIEHKVLHSLKYGEWVKSLPLPASFTLLQMESLRGNSLLVIEPSLARAIVDTLFGGNAQIASTDGREFSATELQVIARIAQLFCDSLNQACPSITRMGLTPTRHEAHPRFAQIAKPSELIAMSSFAIKLKGNSVGELHMCTPCLSLDPILDLLNNGPHNDSGRRDAGWTSTMASHIANAQAELRFEISRKAVRLQDARNYQIGDVLDIGSVGEALNATGYCNGVRLLKGTPGNQNGKLSVCLTGARKMSN